MSDEIPVLASSSATDETPQERILRSWREVAQHMNRGVRTVQRWEKQFQLPIHRVGNRGEIFAFAAEVDAWFTNFSKHALLSGDGQNDGQGKDWREIAEQASLEKDPERLMLLIEELNRLLLIDETKSQRKPDPPPPGPANTTA